MYFCGVSFEITKILKSPICAGTLKMRGKNPLKTQQRCVCRHNAVP